MSQPTPSDAPRDSSYRLCADPHRRYLLARYDPGERITVGELTTEFLEWRDDVSDATVDSDRRRRTRLSLVHEHLPYLEDHGVVVVDPATDRVRVTDGVEAALPAELERTDLLEAGNR